MVVEWYRSHRRREFTTASPAVGGENEREMGGFGWFGKF